MGGIPRLGQTEGLGKSAKTYKYVKCRIGFSTRMERVIDPTWNTRTNVMESDAADP